MSERSLVVAPGSGIPITARGRSIAYGPPPWRMHGRTLALRYLLADPDEARRHVPAGLEMYHDPVVRARFWDMRHDALRSLGDDGGPEVWTPFREAVIAFPVRRGDVAGDYPTYMYADDFAYTAMGREVMGWPVRDGDISVEPEPPGGPIAGTTLAAGLVRGGVELMHIDMTLTGDHRADIDTQPPRWLATKIIPHATRPVADVAQLLQTGPERIHSRTIWSAQASLQLGEGVGDELHHLRPRQIIAAEYWNEVDLTIGWATILDELGDSPW